MCAFLTASSWFCVVCTFGASFRLRSLAKSWRRWLGCQLSARAVRSCLWPILELCMRRMAQRVVWHRCYRNWGVFRAISIVNSVTVKTSARVSLQIHCETRENSFLNRIVYTRMHIRSDHEQKIKEHNSSALHNQSPAEVAALLSFSQTMNVSCEQQCVR